MASIPMTLSYLEGHFCCLKSLYLPTSGYIARIRHNYNMITHEWDNGRCL